MKTLSGTFAFKLALLTAIAIVAAYAFRAFATATPTPTPAPQKFDLVFGKFEPATGSVTEYAELKDKDKFDKLLCKVKEHGGEYDVKFLPNSTATPIYPYHSPYNPPCPRVTINTDKITTSELAKNAPAEESSAHDPHAVYRVQSNRIKDIKQDIKAILDTFKEED